LVSSLPPKLSGGSIRRAQTEPPYPKRAEGRRQRGLVCRNENDRRPEGEPDHQPASAEGCVRDHQLPQRFPCGLVGLSGAARRQMLRGFAIGPAAPETLWQDWRSIKRTPITRCSGSRIPSFPIMFNNISMAALPISYFG
jgi:hypothetical protein